MRSKVRAYSHEGHGPRADRHTESPARADPARTCRGLSGSVGSRGKRSRAAFPSEPPPGWSGVPVSVSARFSPDRKRQIIRPAERRAAGGAPRVCAHRAIFLRVGPCTRDGNGKRLGRGDDEVRPSRGNARAERSTLPRPSRGSNCHGGTAAALIASSSHSNNAARELSIDLAHRIA